MKIKLQELHKRYQFDPIFSGINYTFEPKTSYAITGANGSGKSTLLKMIAGLESISDGTISYNFGDKTITTETLYRYLSIVAPYQEIPEELTLSELIHFHCTLKKLPKEKLIKAAKDVGLQKALNKQLTFFSSGMKQRAKLILALYAETPLILLDEPCTNLDSTGISWYRDIMSQHHRTKTIIISSNATEEHDFCDETILIEDYK